jgi:hypothetical protein
VLSSSRRGAGEMSDVTAAVLADTADDRPVADWLAERSVERRKRQDQSKPRLGVTCAAAVDPLEIAANLEAAGMTSRLVCEASGHPDVFALARELWADVAYEPVDVAPEKEVRSGNWRDLARGVLYAAPALLLYALMRALRVEVAWWTLPLGVTWGWALGQVMAVTGYTLRGRGLGAAAAHCGSWLLVLAPISTALLCAGATSAFGGGITSVVAATILTTYMVAGAILLLEKKELMAALLLAPGAAATVVGLLVGSTTRADAALAIVILGTVAATVVGAALHLRFSLRGDVGLGAADVGMTAASLLHGVLCGVALSLVAIQGAHVNAAGPNPAVAALPLLLTLGVMEWQLSTFNARIWRLMCRHGRLDRFRPAASAVFRRSFGIYVLACVTASLSVGFMTWVADGSPPTALLAAQVVLGAAYFLDLLIMSLGRLDLALPCWLVGAGAGLVYAVWGRAMSIEPNVLVWRSACVAIVVVSITLLVQARHVARAASSH